MRKLLVPALILAVAPVFLLADTGIAFARGWWTTNQTWIAVVSIALLVLVALLLLLGTARGRAFFGRRAKQLVLLNVAVVASWLLLEGALGVLIGQKLWFHRREPGVQRELNPKPGTVPGVTGAARYTTNALGMRGPELPEDRSIYRILCVGGSTTACLYLDDTETWPQLLAAELSRTVDGREFWAADVGKSGYGTWHHTRFFAGGGAHLLGMMDCVVVLVGINDLNRVVSGRRIDTVIARPLWDRSNVLTIAHNIYQARKDARRHRNEANDAASLDIRRSEREAAVRLPSLPDLTVGLEQYATNLRTMIRLARASGVRLVFATQPVLWKERGMSERARRLCWFGYDEGRTPTVEKMAAGMKRFNERLLAVCRESGVECIDLSEMNGIESLYYDDCHFTEAGSREVARRLAAALRARGFPGPVR